MPLQRIYDANIATEDAQRRASDNIDYGITTRACKIKVTERTYDAGAGKRYQLRCEPDEQSLIRDGLLSLYNHRMYEPFIVALREVSDKHLVQNIVVHLLQETGAHDVDEIRHVLARYNQQQARLADGVHVLVKETHLNFALS